FARGGRQVFRGRRHVVRRRDRVREPAARCHTRRLRQRVARRLAASQGSVGALRPQADEARVAHARRDRKAFGETRALLARRPNNLLSQDSTMRIRLLGLSLALGACARATPSTSPTPVAGSYDLVISGGKIVDGTGDPWFYGDVAIIGDRIVRI